MKGTSPISELHSFLVSVSMSSNLIFTARSVKPDPGILPLGFEANCTTGLVEQNAQRRSAEKAVRLLPRPDCPVGLLGG